MKHLLLSFVLLIGTQITNATSIKPLPWDKPITKSIRVFSPITEVDIWLETSVTPNRVDITVKRPFAYTTCEYTTIQVWGKVRFLYGFPRTAYYLWTWISCTVTIPAYSDTGYTSFYLKDGEEVDVNTYMSPGYLDYCY